MLDPTALERALEAVGAVLAARGLNFEIVSIGGSSLLLLGLTVRATRDLDVVALVRNGQYLPAEPLPPALVEAARDVGDALRLGERWLNAGPAELLDHGLPEVFADRAEP